MLAGFDVFCVRYSTKTNCGDLKTCQGFLLVGWTIFSGTSEACMLFDARRSTTATRHKELQVSHPHVVRGPNQEKKRERGLPSLQTSSWLGQRGRAVTTSIMPSKRGSPSPMPARAALSLRASQSKPVWRLSDVCL